MNDTVIKLEGLTKVFLTDEVETHALTGIHLEIKKGTYISIAGPSGCLANARVCATARSDSSFRLSI